MAKIKIRYRDGADWVETYDKQYLTIDEAIEQFMSDRGHNYCDLDVQFEGHEIIYQASAQKVVSYKIKHVREDDAKATTNQEARSR